MPFSLSLTPGEKHALFLSMLAGMSTTLGALIAIVRRPNAADLAFLLGVALGVMGVLSVCEMWLHNARENGIAPVSLAFAGGAAAYCLLAPLLPEVSSAAGGRWGLGESAGGGEGAVLVGASAGGKPPAASSSSSSAGAARGGARRAPPAAAAAAAAAAATPASKDLQPAPAPPAPPPLSPAELLRLGLVVAVAMTAHNLPEGFAVAFSSFTPLGPTMVLAIAAHNIPEGVVVAAPVFAATGSRLAALGLAAASGMSEPVGAAAALLLARPWLPGAAAAAGGGGAAAAAVTESRLALVLAASGGVMAAVCAVDLYPQGKKCAAPSRLAAGSALGALAMAATLALGV